jgi:D-alanyl-D-alanine carboxypeptidase/D-alanyl-D-alanine-endopeptidase (penicillin-binding protein 4)
MENKNSRNNRRRLMNRSVIVILACISAIVNTWASDLDIQKEIQSYLKAKKYEGRGIGVVIKDVEEQKELVSVNGSEMLNPASVSKLVTGAAAFELLGTDYQFSTRVL